MNIKKATKIIKEHGKVRKIDDQNYQVLFHECTNWQDYNPHKLIRLARELRTTYWGVKGRLVKKFQNARVRSHTRNKIQGGDAEDLPQDGRTPTGKFNI